MNWADFEDRRGLRCLPAIAAPLILGLATNNPVDGLVAAAGAMSVGFGSFQELYHSRIAPMLIASVAMAVSAFVGTLVGHSDAGISLVAGIWGFVCGLLIAVGPGASYIGMQSVIFLLLATGFPVGLKAAENGACLVLCGGLLQTLVVTVIRMFWIIPHTRSMDRLSARGPARGAWLALHTLRRNALRRTAAYRYAVRMGLTLAIAAALSRLAPNHHSYWMPLTAAIVLRPDFHETFTKALSRFGGTLIGAGFATAIAANARPDPADLAILVVVFAWLSYSFLKVNYAIAAGCITSYVVFLVALIGLPESTAAITRVGFTSVGALVAMLAYAIRPISLRRRVIQSA